MFDPVVFATHFWAALAVLAAIILANGLASPLVMQALGVPLHQRLAVAAAIAQVGEFSFLLAGFGLALGLISQHAPALLLGGALISIALHPFLFRGALAMARRSTGQPRATDRPGDPPTR